MVYGVTIACPYDLHTCSVACWSIRRKIRGFGLFYKICRYLVGRVWVQRGMCVRCMPVVGLFDEKNTRGWSILPDL